jgi:hypothetical protein
LHPSIPPPWIDFAAQFDRKGCIKKLGISRQPMLLQILLIIGKAEKIPNLFNFAYTLTRLDYIQQARNNDSLFSSRMLFPI